MRGTFIFLVVFLSIFSNAAIARDPELDSLIRDARSAVGGEQDLAKVKSIYAEAECEGPSGRYRTAVTSFNTDKSRFEQTFSYKPGRSITHINGAVAWTIENGRPAIATPFAKMAARSHEYQKIAYDFERYFNGLELAGEADFNGKRTIVVRGKNELGMAARLYFEKGNSRFAGYEIDLPEAGGVVRNVIVEWRRVGKLNLPSVVRATDSKGDWTLRFDRIVFNKADEGTLDVPARVADMAEILRMHEEQKAAHLTYDVELFVGNYPEQPISLSKGNVSRSTREQTLKRVRQYFSSFKFIEWEDIAPPVIKVSGDGTMATKIVHKRVRGTYKDANGKDVAEHVIYAWLEVLEKIDGKWRLVTIASTDKPGGN